MHPGCESVSMLLWNLHDRQGDLKMHSGSESVSVFLGNLHDQDGDLKMHPGSESVSVCSFGICRTDKVT